MFLRNRTPHKVVLARGHATENLALASVNLELVYRLNGDHLTVEDGHQDRLPSDPPDITARPVWSGTSVTVSGTAHGPSRPPYV
jgi:hypothetical protein